MSKSTGDESRERVMAEFKADLDLGGKGPHEQSWFRGLLTMYGLGLLLSMLLHLTVFPWHVPRMFFFAIAATAVAVILYMVGILARRFWQGNW